MANTHEVTIRIPLTNWVGQTYASHIWHTMVVNERGVERAQCNSSQNIDVEAITEKARLEIGNETRPGRPCRKCL